MKIENTVTVSHTGEVDAHQTSSQRALPSRHSKESNSGGRNLHTMLQKRTYRNISSHVRKHKINHQSSAQNLSQIGQSIGHSAGSHNLAKVSQKHAARRQGFMGSKLATIQEEIDKANCGQEPDPSDDRADAISEDQQIDHNQNQMTNQMVKISGTRHGRKKVGQSRTEKKGPEPIPGGSSKYKNLLDSLHERNVLHDSARNTPIGSPSKKAARPPVSISVNTTRTGGENPEFSCSPGISPSPTLRRGNGREGKETMPARTFDESREDEIIQMIEDHQRVRLEIDPMRELEEALMDRTTASLNRRNKMNTVSKQGIQSSADVEMEVQQQQGMIQPTFIQIDLDSDEPLKTLSAQEAAIYCQDLYLNNRGEGPSLNKRSKLDLKLHEVSAAHTSPGLNPQPYETSSPIPKFKLDRKKCPSDDVTLSYHDEPESDEIEEPSRKVRRSAQYPGCSASEQVNHGYHRDIDTKKETKVKFKSQGEQGRTNNQRFDQESDQILRENFGKDTRPANSMSFDKYRSGSNRTVQIQNGSIIQEDSNQILRNSPNCGQSSEETQINSRQRNHSKQRTEKISQDAFETYPKNMRKNVSMDVNGKNTATEEFVDQSQFQNGMMSPSDDKPCQSAQLNKRNLKSYQKKMTASQTGKFACQTLDTVQNGSSNIIGTKNRKKNNVKNSWNSSDDQDNDFDANEENELVRHCNINQEDTEDELTREKLRKYKYWAKNQINLDLAENMERMSSLERNQNLNIPQKQQNKTCDNTPQLQQLNNQFVQNLKNQAQQNQSNKLRSQSTEAQKHRDWVSSKYQEDLNLLNKSIKPLPMARSQENSSRHSVSPDTDQRGGISKLYTGSRRLSKQQFLKNSKYLGLKNCNNAKQSSLQNFDKCFKNTLLKMLGLSNTLSLWNLKQKTHRQKLFQMSANGTGQLPNTATSNGPQNLSNIIRLARAQQLAQFAQRQQVAQMQARVQAAVQVQAAQAVQKRMALLNGLNPVEHQAAFDEVNSSGLGVPLFPSDINEQLPQGPQAHPMADPTQQAHARALQLQQQMLRNRLKSQQQQSQEQQRVFQAQANNQLAAQWLQMMQQKC